jgi:hypothetical protein
MISAVFSRASSQMTLLEAELERIRQRLEALEKTADIIKKD